MRRRRLVWQIFPSYVFITFLSLAAVSWLASRTIRSFNTDLTAQDLVARCRMLDHEIAFDSPEGHATDIDRLCKVAGKLIDARFTVIRPSGEVAGDSEAEPSGMENHAGRAEVVEALAGRVGVTTRFSDTLHENMMYAAVPMWRSGRLAGVVRCAFPLSMIDEHLRNVRRHMLVGTLLVALLAAGISLAVARRISRPLERIRRGAERFAQGDLAGAIHASETMETAQVAEALNLMAAQLDERLQTVIKDRNEKDALFACMIEGVLAVDGEERLVELNAAAAALLHLDALKALGRPLLEVVRNPDLEQVISRALAESGPVEAEIVFRNEVERVMQAYGAALRDRTGRRIGALVTLFDVTRLKQLEAVRRDFVANVSHELKTPITSIQGAAETLLDAGDLVSPRGRSFVKMIDRHTRRLTTLIEDMLILARIEHNADLRRPAIQSGRVDAVLSSASDICSAAASEKNISVGLECEPGLEAPMNAPLVEQAVVNLVRNAIQYSEPGSTVRIGARREGSDVLVEVVDHGCGIEARHIPRLFERFYRVDSARSRELGGTGLGLAIVKHIALAHGGQVGVKSEPGRGSTFTIRLPAA